MINGIGGRKADSNIFSSQSVLLSLSKDQLPENADFNSWSHRQIVRQWKLIL
jgi:hypothetical protein